MIAIANLPAINATSNNFIESQTPR